MFRCNSRCVMMNSLSTYIKFPSVFSLSLFFRGCFEKEKMHNGEEDTLPDEEESWTELSAWFMVYWRAAPTRAGRASKQHPLLDFYLSSSTFSSFFFQRGKEEKYPSRCSLLWFFECLTCCWNSLSLPDLYLKGENGKSMYRDGLLFHFISYKWRNEEKKKKVVTGKDGGRRHSRVSSVWDRPIYWHINWCIVTFAPHLY